MLLSIGMMGNMIGLFFRPFAMTTPVVNLASLFISFTLTPILCAPVMRPRKAVKEDREPRPRIVIEE